MKAITVLLFVILWRLLTPLASGQLAGEILWTVDLAYSSSISAPVVGPDGTIYVHAGEFYAIAPDGSVRWSKPLFGPKAVSVGEDGTVYAGSSWDVFAYDPNGNLLWNFTEPPGGQGLMAGPTVGPDGNIYAISDWGGLGAFSLTTDGELRWNVTGFLNNAGTGLSPVPLGLDRLYFSEHTVPGCVVTGMTSIDLEGNVDWCAELSGVNLARPVVPPNGNAYITSANNLYSFSPDGSIDWLHQFPIPGGGFIGTGVGPDNSAYLFHAYIDLWAFDEDGNVLWIEDNIVSSTFPIRPSVAPDNRTIVFGTSYSFGVNGSVFAVDPMDGAVLWSLPIEGPSSGVSGPAVFSLDGEVVYVPVGPVSSSLPTKLMAIQVREASPGISCSDIFFFNAKCNMNGAAQAMVKMSGDWTGETVTFDLNGTDYVSTVMSNGTNSIAKMTVPHAGMGTHTVTLEAPAGCYTPVDITCAVDAPSDPEWDALWAEYDVLEAQASQRVLPEGTRIIGNYPNPFNPSTTIRYSLNAGSPVTIRVHNMLGEVVSTLVEEYQGAGHHEVVWDGRNNAGSPVSSGMYIYRLTAGGFSETRRILLAK